LIEPHPPTTPGDAAPDPDLVQAEIAREQAHVDRCYEQLARARVRAEAGVDRAMKMPVSTPQSLFERDAELHRSLTRLSVISTSEQQLVFGRLDMEDTAEPVYVGRVGLSDETRNRILVDWRAPVGSTFYRATARDPRGVIRRRTLVTRGRKVVELNDDLLIPDKATGFQVVVGEGALLRSLQRERGPFMQDILATIQGEQDEIIRADPKANVVLTGGPGTGKSVVALHRTAYLMFERAEELERRGVLFVGPTARFGKYISHVLPSLGETAAQIRSVFNLTEPVTALSREPLAAGRLKGQPQMAAVMRTLLIATYPKPGEELHLRTGRWRLDLTVSELAHLRDEAVRSGEGMNRARARFLRALARRLLGGGSGRRDDRKAVQAMAEELVEESELDRLMEAILPIRDPDEAWAEIKARPRDVERAAARSFSAQDARLIAEDMANPELRVGDLPLLDEVRVLLGDPPPTRAEREEEEMYGAVFSFQDTLDQGRQQTLASKKAAGFGHIVVDEAQDLTPMQWRSLARLGPYATWNVVGDPNQATLATPEQMAASIAELPGAGRQLRFELGINYRTPAEIMRYASQVSGLDLGKLQSIRTGGEPAVFEFDDDPSGALRRALESARAEPGSMCVIVMDEADVAAVTAVADDADVLTAIDAKGLEFDNVVLYRPDRLLPVSSPADASLLLIAASRATRSLTVVTAAGAEG
jgi:hypothetical protein